MLIKKKLLNQNTSVESNFANQQPLNNEFNELKIQKELASKEAQNIIQKAKEEAKLILEEAAAEAENILNSAEERVKENIEKALNQKMQRINELEIEAADELRVFGDFKKEILQDSKNEILEVAIELASKIIHKKVKENSSILENLFQEAIQEVLNNIEAGQISLTFTINPEDREISQKFAEKIEAQNNRIEITLKEDPEIAEGSCQVESPSGILDWNFKSQLELFKEKMLASNF